MFSKLKLVLLGLLAAVLAFGSVTAAFADEGMPPTATKIGTRWGGGQVTAVGSDNLTLHDRRGNDHVIYVDGASHFFNGQGDPARLADVQVGDRVVGVVEGRADGKLYAKLVVIIPPQTHYKGVGVISAVNADEKSFQFVSRLGKLWEFYVDDNTQITDRSGASLTFADLQAGQRAGVAAELRADGKWWATQIKIGRKP